MEISWYTPEYDGDTLVYTRVWWRYPDIYPSMADIPGYLPKYGGDTRKSTRVEAPGHLSEYGQNTQILIPGYPRLHTLLTTPLKLFLP